MNHASIDYIALLERRNKTLSIEVGYLMAENDLLKDRLYLEADYLEENEDAKLEQARKNCIQE